METIKEQLQALYSKDFQISKEMYLKVQQLASEEYAKTKLTLKATSMNTSASGKTAVAVEPLFCKDTIYHASICSQAISTCTAGDYQKFFKNKELVPGHAFKAVSFSRSRNESFLIAQKDESMFYFAFKGRLSLSDWAKDYKSFNEGKINIASSSGSLRSLTETTACTFTKLSTIVDHMIVYYISQAQKPPRHSLSLASDGV